MHNIKIKPRTLNEWKKIFDDWSNKMNELYDDKDRNDATMWSDNPADWMTPFSSIIFDTWSEYDVGAPMWNRNLKNSKLLKVE